MNKVVRSSDAAWFLAQVKPNGDEIAEQHLKRQGFDVFAPKVTHRRAHRGRLREELRALFPGYLFVSASTPEAGWRAIGHTMGVQKLVSFGTAPARVCNELIERLMKRCDSKGRVVPPALQPGDSVRVISGPFANFVGSVEKIQSEQRVWILLDLMGKTRRIAMASSRTAPYGSG